MRSHVWYDGTSLSGAQAIIAAMAAPHMHVQRASRELIQIARGSTDTHAHLRDRVLAIVWVSVLVAAFCTVGVYFTERHAPGTQIHNVFDAGLFATSHLLTASSVATPATTAGKVLQLFFDIYAITVVATLAGSFGAFFHRRGLEKDAAKAEGSRAAA